MRTGPACAARPDPRSPKFRRVLFVRDGALDHGGASAPRITALTILPSAVSTASASAASIFRGSISHPTQSLCTLRDGRHLPPRNTRYRAVASLTRTGLPPARTRQLLGAPTGYILHQIQLVRRVVAFLAARSPAGDRPTAYDLPMSCKAQRRSLTGDTHPYYTNSSWRGELSRFLRPGARPEFPRSLRNR